MKDKVFLIHKNMKFYSIFLIYYKKIKNKFLYREVINEIIFICNIIIIK